ncbi:MAG: hypothetical protein ACTSQI_15285 [Candidatus Helarchaeota archaeon]
MDVQLREIVSFLVKQQFARDNDTISDRMKSQKLHITGSSKLIAQFIDLLARDLSEIIAGNYENYLKEICHYCDLEMAEIVHAFSERIAILEPEDHTPPLILTSLLSEFLGKIREKAFKGALQEIKRRVIIDQQIPDYELQGFNRRFKKLITDLFQRNESNISLLYNLCFLIFLADLLNFNKVKRTTKILQGRYMNRLVQKLSKLSSN